MNIQNFLKTLKKEGKLKLVSPSREVKLSYFKKAENCIKSSKLLFKNNLYENSVSESYYAMYNSLLALLFSVGIKSENHSASIILLKFLFNQEELVKLIDKSKRERIEKQYYVSTEENLNLLKLSAKELISESESFLLGIRALINSFNNEKIDFFRRSFLKLI
ncbi:MAG: HEPN domain-containing protein [Nanoarchaeota archaeon]|nr:HEPN domain-containing protein [Nanoarchaeota archaeon]